MESNQGRCQMSPSDVHRGYIYMQNKYINKNYKSSSWVKLRRIKAEPWRCVPGLTSRHGDVCWVWLPGPTCEFSEFLNKLRVFMVFEVVQSWEDNAFQFSPFPPSVQCLCHLRPLVVPALGQSSLACSRVWLPAALPVSSREHASMTIIGWSTDPRVCTVPVMRLNSSCSTRNPSGLTLREGAKVSTPS